jgi:hypothetical protein
MTTEERIEGMERKLRGLPKVQDEMLDVLGLTVEGERRLATRMEQIEELHREHDKRMIEVDIRLVEIGDKLNALIGVVDGFIRGKN